MKETYTEKIKHILAHPFWGRRGTIMGLGIVIVLISMILHIHNLNNFRIFKYVFWHAVEHRSLYEVCPEEYYDCNHYGPLFSLIIAPFAVIPWFDVAAGAFHAFLVVWFYCAIKDMEWERWKKVALVWLLAQELLFTVMWSQFNVAVAAMIILTFSAVRREREGLAAFWIMLGTLIKIYGIVGLAFWLFSKHKVRFIGWCCLWGAVLFALPMLFWGAEYTLLQYQEWAYSLTAKSGENVLAPFQNISLPGVIRKVGYSLTEGRDAYMAVFREQQPANPANWWMNGWSDLYAIIPGIVLYFLPLCRFGQYQHHVWQLSLLASTLIFVNIFSSGSEECSYILSMSAMVVWYYGMPWKRSRTDTALLVLAMVASFSVTDLMPSAIRTGWIRPYALKSVPFIIIWLKLTWEMCTKNYAPVIRKQS